MSTTVKAYLQKPGDHKEEIRRFTVPVDVSTNYAYMERKVAEIFPNLKRADLVLQWQDPDGEYVDFSSDEELIGALSFRKDDVFRIFVNEKEKKSASGSNPDEVHPGVICDVCNTNICGPRYNCCVCPDYDLCSTCNMQGNHGEHEMLKIPKPKETGRGGLWGFTFGRHHPPPYFRRWMNRYMRRWHKSNDCKNKDEQPEDSEEKDQEQEEEYLKGVGENIAAMLDPFGIDVHVDVDHNEERTHCEPPKWGAHGFFGCRGGGRGKRHCKEKGRICGKGETKMNEDETADVQQKVADMDIKKDGVDGVDGPECAPMDQEMKDGEGEWTFLKTDESPSESDKSDKPKEDKPEGKSDKQNKEEDVEEVCDEDPSFLHYLHPGPPPHPGHQPHPHIGPCVSYMGPPHFMGPFPRFVPPRGPATFPGLVPRHHPAHGKPPGATSTLEWPKDPKIGEVLLQMLNMGFNNDNGWLTHLLEEYDGDIGKVLDAIKAGRHPGGRMA